MRMDRPGKKASWVLALVMAVSAPAALAQKTPKTRNAENVNIGGVSLKLGEPRARALGQARSKFNVSPAHQSGQYFLYPKATPLNRHGQPRKPETVGSMTLANGRLVRVTRSLGSFRSADGKAAIQNLIRAFAQAPNKGRQPAVHTDTSMSGDASTTRVYFSYPDRVIQVLVFQPADTSIKATVDISEQYALQDTQTSGTAIPGP